MPLRWHWGSTRIHVPRRFSGWRRITALLSGSDPFQAIPGMSTETSATFPCLSPLGASACSAVFMAFHTVISIRGLTGFAQETRPFPDLRLPRAVPFFRVRLCCGLYDDPRVTARVVRCLLRHYVSSASAGRGPEGRTSDTTNHPIRSPFIGSGDGRTSCTTPAALKRGEPLTDSRQGRGLASHEPFLNQSRPLPVRQQVPKSQ